MSHVLLTRRSALVTAGCFAALGTAGLTTPARAQGVAPTPSMRGGSNNYRPGAPIVQRIGGGGFWMTGTSKADFATFSRQFVHVRCSESFRAKKWALCKDVLPTQRPLACLRAPARLRDAATPV